jgi:hypothetical protein
VWSSFVTAVFAFTGIELVGVTADEAQNPRKTIPRAIRLTFARIAFFYVTAVFLLGLLVPYNSSQLLFANSAGSTAAASPFVVAINISGIGTLPGILNGCIFIFTFSAANSGTLPLYFPLFLLLCHQLTSCKIYMLDLERSTASRGKGKPLLSLQKPQNMEFQSTHFYPTCS